MTPNLHTLEQFVTRLELSDREVMEIARRVADNQELTSIADLSDYHVQSMIDELAEIERRRGS